MYNRYDPQSESQPVSHKWDKTRSWEYNRCPKCEQLCVGLYYGSTAKYEMYRGICRGCGARFRFTSSGTVHESEQEVDRALRSQVVVEWDDDCTDLVLAACVTRVIEGISASPTARVASIDLIGDHGSLKRIHVVKGSEAAE